jgi:hypothetical protein
VGVNAASDVSASGVSPYAPHDWANSVLSGTFSDEQVSAPLAIYGWFNVSIWASYSSSLATTANSLSATIGTAGSIAKGNSIYSTNTPAGATIQGVSGTTLTLYLPPVTIRGRAVVGSTHITGLNSTDGLTGAAITGLGVPASTTVSSIVTAAVAATANSPGVKGEIIISNQITATTADSSDTPFVFVRDGHGITASATDSAAVYVGNELTFSGTIQLERSFDGGHTWIPCFAWWGGSQLKWTTEMSTVLMEPEKGVLYRLNCVAYTSGTMNYRISTTGQAATTLNVPL